MSCITHVRQVNKRLNDALQLIQSGRVDHGKSKLVRVIGMNDIFLEKEKDKLPLTNNCPVSNIYCSSYSCETDRNGEVAIEFCSHSENKNKYEGNCTSWHCPKDQE